MISILALALAQQAVPPAAPPVPKKPSACPDAADHAFDFWIGQWFVFKTDAPPPPVARSRISSASGGCAILEQWQPYKDQPGTSITARDPDGRGASAGSAGAAAMSISKAGPTPTARWC